MNFSDIAASHTLDAILVVDAESFKICYTNRTFSKIFGHPEKTVLGKPLSFFQGPKSDPETLEHIKSQFTLGLSFSVEWIAYRKNNQPIWVEIHFSPVNNDSGDITHWSVVYRLIEDRKQFQDSMMRISDHLNLVVSKAPIALLAIDGEGVFKIAEGKVLETLGLTPDALVDKSIFDLYADYPEFLEDIRKALTGEISKSIAVFSDTYLEFNYERLNNPEGECIGLIGVSIDLTERVQHEKELVKAKDRAEAATKTKSEFLANMSHEIRTPLNGILGFSEILIQSIKDPSLNRYTKAIATSGKNLLHIINDILDLSKIEAGKLELQAHPVSPAEVVSEIQILFSLQAEAKGLDFEVECTCDPQKRVSLDSTRLRQVLFNLTGNAIKYTDSGFVKLKCYEEASENEDTANLTFEVQDSGHGISKEDQKAIFETFTQKHAHTGGVGLGLSITQRLINLMGGTVSLESKRGKGSTFTVKLKNIPATISKLPTRSPFEETVETIDFHQACVLIIDDMEINLEILKLFLSNTHVKIIELSNATESVNFAENYHPDIILLDLKMPDVDGYKVTEALKKNPKTKQIPIIAVTAQILDNEEDKVKAAGFNGFLRKPINQKILIEELKKFLPYSKPEELAEKILEGNRSYSRKELEPLIEQLEEKLVQECSKIKGTHVIGNIKNFAKKINYLNRTYTVPELAEYSKQLNEHTYNYDLEKIQETLELFPKLIERLRSSLKE